MIEQLENEMKRRFAEDILDLEIGDSVDIDLDGLVIRITANSEDEGRTEYRMFVVGGEDG